MSSNPEKGLSFMYSELNKFKQASDYEKALKASNRILHTAPNEKKALHCKIVCLLQLSKFEEALNAVNKNPDVASNFHFEKAYCYYRLNDSTTAFKILESAPEKTDQICELKAQVLYRLEQFNECFNLYRDIIKKTNDDYEQERQTNLSAVIANLNTKEANSVNPEEIAYEICYNSAYKLIQQGLYNEAEKKLKKCENMCREYLEEDGYTEEEIESELAIIKVQLAYCYQKQNRVKDAQQLYKDVLALKLEDIGLVAVASNNMVVINKDHNVFDSKKKMKHATLEVLNHKLNNQQRKTIALNNCLLNYYIGQNELCRKLCSKFIEDWPDMKVAALIIKAMLEAKEGGVDSAVKSIQNIDAKSENEKLYVNLVCVHLLLSQDKKQEACKILHNLDAASYRPGIVGALVALHVGLGDERGAAKVFEDTVAWYRQSQRDQGDVGNMWFQAADFHMTNGHPRVAANCLEEILNSNSNDLWTIAKLILAYVQCDSKQANSLSQRLPSIDSLTKDVEWNNIESSNWIFGLKTSKSRTDNSSPGTPKTDLIKKKKIKKKKGKLPKNYNAEVAPDPERWLPKYERTGYRKKRDRRTKDVIKGSQGQNPGASEMYDFSRNVEEAQEIEIEKKMSGNMEDPSPRASAKKGGQKKKKKSSKW